MLLVSYTEDPPERIIVLQALHVDKKKRHFFSRKLLFTKSKERSKSENALSAEVSKGLYMCIYRFYSCVSMHVCY